MTRGQKLKEARGKRTQKSVAAELGISRSALEMYENDSRSPKDALKSKIAGYYGMTVQELFF